VQHSLGTGGDHFPYAGYSQQQVGNSTIYDEEEYKRLLSKGYSHVQAAQIVTSSQSTQNSSLPADAILQNAYQPSQQIQSFLQSGDGRPQLQQQLSISRLQSHVPLAGDRSGSGEAWVSASETDINAIVGMGFSRTQAVEALRKFNNNLMCAVDSLIG